MKNYFMLVALLLLCLTGQTQTILKDGFYEVYEFSNDTGNIKYKGTNKTLICFNKDFKEDAPKDYKGLVIFTNEFVPLELEKLPELVMKKV